MCAQNGDQKPYSLNTFKKQFVFRDQSLIYINLIIYEK